MFYEEVFRGLNKNRVKYVVVGGVAVVLHGVVRFTADLDLFVGLSKSNLLRFAEVLTKLGYRPKVPVKATDFADTSNRKRWKKEKGMVVFSFFHFKRHQDSIDVFVYEPIKFDRAYRERKIIDAEGIKIPVISMKHLKELKDIARRPQDLADIDALEVIETLNDKYAKKKDWT